MLLRLVVRMQLELQPSILRELTYTRPLLPLARWVEVQAGDRLMRFWDAWWFLCSARVSECLKVPTMRANRMCQQKSGRNLGTCTWWLSYSSFKDCIALYDASLIAEYAILQASSDSLEELRMFPRTVPSLCRWPPSNIDGLVDPEMQCLTPLNDWVHPSAAGGNFKFELQRDCVAWRNISGNFSFEVWIDPKSWVSMLNRFPVDCLPCHCW